MRFVKNASFFGKELESGSKRVQIPTDVNIRENYGERELLINLNFSKYYSNRKQNEIQSPFFGNNSFSLFTACVFYKNQGKTENAPVKIATGGPNKSRVTSISRVDILIQLLWSEIEKEIDSIHIILIDVQRSSDRVNFFVCLNLIALF